MISLKISVRQIAVVCCAKVTLLYQPAFVTSAFLLTVRMETGKSSRQNYFVLKHLLIWYCSQVESVHSFFTQRFYTFTQNSSTPFWRRRNPYLLSILCSIHPLPPPGVFISHDNRHPKWHFVLVVCVWCVCVCLLSVHCVLPLSCSVPLPPAAWHFLCFLSPAITARINTHSWQPFSPSPFYFNPPLSPCLFSPCLSLTIDTDASLSLSYIILSEVLSALSVFLAC